MSSHLFDQTFLESLDEHEAEVLRLAWWKVRNAAAAIQLYGDFVSRAVVFPPRDDAECNLMTAIEDFIATRRRIVD